MNLTDNSFDRHTAEGSANVLSRVQPLHLVDLGIITWEKMRLDRAVSILN